MNKIKNPDLLDKLDNLANKYQEIAFYIDSKGVWKYTEVVKPKNITVSYIINDII